MKKITDTKIIEAAEHWYINDPTWETIKTDNAEYIAKIYAEIDQVSGEQINGYALYEARHRSDPEVIYLEEDDEPIGWFVVTAELIAKNEEAEKANESEFDLFKSFAGA